MNKNRIFAIFILVALLITCVGVSFASNDFDSAYMDEISQDDSLEIDDSDLDDEQIGDVDDDDYSLDDEDSDLEDWDFDDFDFDDWGWNLDDLDFDDEDWDDEDSDLDDEDWDDEDWDDDWDLDDEDWDDEDWDDDWDLDDEDWDDEDWDLDDEDDDYSELAWFKEGNFTEDGKVYYYCLTAYKNGRALGCSYMLPDSDTSDENEKSTGNEDKPMASGCDENSSTDSNPTPTANENHVSIAKTIDLGDLKDTIKPDDSKNTSKKNTTTNKTIAFESTNDNDLGIFALLALLLVSLVVII